MDDQQAALVRWLSRKAWNPVLRAGKQHYSEQDQQRLERVQRKTERQRDRYKEYASAGEVRQEFEDDLHSKAAASTNADLRKLGLPTQADVAKGFFALADRLGIEPRRSARSQHHPHPPHPWHKSKPEHRERARKQLKQQAREGDADALQTLRSAPRKWARDYAAELEKRQSRRGSSAPRKHKTRRSSG